jgi:hypothetical protein
MRPFSHWLWLCVWLGLGLYLALTLWLGLLGLVYPYQLDYGEGIVLWFARELAHGHSIYALPGVSLASSNYPPVSMLFAAALMPLLGEGYAAGRLLNFSSALLVASLIYRIVLYETKGARGSADLVKNAGPIASALLFIGSPYVYHWVPQFRADLLGLALSFGGIYWIWRFSHHTWGDDVRRETVFGRRSVGYLILAALSFLLALYTKQTLLAGPAAAFVALCLRDRRVAIAFALALGAVGGLIYLTIDSATVGGFTFGLITSNATIFLPEQLAELLWNFAATFPVLILLALWGWLNRLRARRVGVLECYFLFSVAMLGLAGRVGAWENYFLEAIAAACIFAGISISALVSRKADRAKSYFQPFDPDSHLPIRDPQAPGFPLRLELSAIGVPVLLIGQLVLMWHDPRVAAELIARDLPANQQLDQVLNRTPGVVISEDMGALVTSGKPVAYYTFQYSSLARSGKWDQSWELNGLRDSLFPLVVLEQGTREDVDHYRRFTREFVSALDRYYVVTETIGKYEIYAPAPLIQLKDANFGDDLALVGWKMEETGSPRSLQITIVWQAKRTITRRFTAFVHLETEDGSRKLAQDDHEPHEGAYPTTRWAPNEMVREVYSLELDGRVDPGKYVLKAGWYDSDTGDRLDVKESTDNTVTLAPYEVK